MKRLLSFFLIACLSACYINNSRAQQSKTRNLPLNYDLRDYGWVPSVKNQGSLGTCWAFVTIGCIEARWLRLDYGDFDLSEQNLATCHAYDPGIDDGGIPLYALAYFTRLDGPYTEDQDPYQDDNAEATCANLTAPPTAFVPEVRWLTPFDNTLVKQMLMDYGAIGTYMVLNPSYFNDADDTYYYSGFSATNHQALIVGWDDNITTAGGTGAWIARNNYGTDWGDQGYFYVAYQDKKFLSQLEIYPEVFDYDPDLKLYYYDELGPISQTGIPNQDVAYGLVKFSGASHEYLRWIGTQATKANAVIDIEIYDDFDGEKLSNYLSGSYATICPFPGFYLFDLPTAVDGDFYAKLKYYTPGHGSPLPIESKTFGIKGTPEIESGIAWISSDGENWQAIGEDISSAKYDLSVKAYTQSNTELIAMFTADKRQVCTGTEVTLTSHALGDIAEYNWAYWEDGQTPETLSGAGPHTISFSTPGRKHVLLSVKTSENQYDSLIRHDYIIVSDTLKVITNQHQQLIQQGHSIDLIAYGADTYAWSPDTELDQTDNDTVSATPTTTRTYTVTGTTDACYSIDTVEVQVVPAIAYDDACNAKALNTGTNGPFTNIAATIENNEPLPPATSCTADKTWCPEYGLQHSVWFSFTAPASGEMSISTTGFDTQIAVYQANTCANLFQEGQHTLLAANDDYYGAQNPAAVIANLLDLTPGQSYWLQVDGSHVGETGDNLMITLGDPLSVDEQTATLQNLKLYPNPAREYLSLNLTNDLMGIIDLSINSLSGKQIIRKQYRKTGVIFEKEISLKSLPAGAYFLTISLGQQSISRKLFIE